MGLLDNLSDQQKKLLMFGVPLVGGAVIISKLRQPPAAPATTPPSGVTMPSTDAIGAGQLADFETSIAAALAALQKQIADSENNSTTSGSTAITTTSYVTVGGDTLLSIALRRYNRTDVWPYIFNSNKATLDAAAAAHGMGAGVIETQVARTEGAFPLWAGVTLVLP